MLSNFVYNVCGCAGDWKMDAFVENTIKAIREKVGNGKVLCALSGGLLAQYQKSCDINVGTGMVTIALASLIIGETLVGKRTMLRRVVGVVFGSCLYRFIVAVALRFNVPAAAMKLVSAIIVAIAISMPAIKAHFAFEKRRHSARSTGKEGK